MPIGTCICAQLEGGIVLAADCQPSVEDIPEGAEHLEIDQILLDWPFLAARAYRAFLCDGPGTLVITVGRDDVAELSYLSKAEACPCCEDLLREYDAECQVVFCVRRKGTQNVYVLTGVPSPRTLHDRAPANLFEETLH